MAAARKVSVAAKIIFLLFFFKILPSLPIVVVFPTPFTPAIKNTLVPTFSLLRISFSSGFINFSM